MNGRNTCKTGKWKGTKRRFTEGMLDNDLILESLQLCEGQTILDAGCGTGYMSRLMAERVGSAGVVHALDVDGHNVEALALEFAGTNIHPVEADISAVTSFPNASMDRVYMSTVLHSIPRDRVPGVVREVRRLLRPGGLFALVELEKRETPFGPPLQQRYSPAELQQVIPLAPVETVSVAEFFYMQVFQSV